MTSKLYTNLRNNIFFNYELIEMTDKKEHNVAARVVSAVSAVSAVRQYLKQ